MDVREVWTARGRILEHGAWSSCLLTHMSKNTVKYIPSNIKRDVQACNYRRMSCHCRPNNTQKSWINEYQCRLGEQLYRSYCGIWIINEICGKKSVDRFILNHITETAYPPLIWINCNNEPLFKSHYTPSLLREREREVHGSYQSTRQHNQTNGSH